MKLSQTEINVILESLNLHYLDICRVLEKSDNLGDIEKKNLLKTQMLLTELINKLK